MPKVVIRRNFGAGAKLTEYQHKKNARGRIVAPVAPDPEGLVPFRRPHQKGSNTNLVKQAERVSYIYFLIHACSVATTDWENSFLDSIETRLMNRRECSVAQMDVIERIISKHEPRPSPYSNFLKEKRDGGPLYVDFLADNFLDTTLE